METEEQNWRIMWLQNGSGASHGDRPRKKSKTEEDGINHTAQPGPGDRGRKKSKKRNGFDLDLISKHMHIFKEGRY